jgi:hypothetical protein
VQTHNTQVLVEGEHNGNKKRTKLLTDWATQKRETVAISFEIFRGQA